MRVNLRNKLIANTSFDYVIDLLGICKISLKLKTLTITDVQSSAFIVISDFCFRGLIVNKVPMSNQTPVKPIIAL